MQINTVTQQTSQQNSVKPISTCHLCKKPSHYRNQCRQLKREKDQTQNNTNSAGNNNNNNGSAQTNSNPNNKVSGNNNANNTNNRRDRKPRPVYPPCETCGRTNYSTEKCYLRANQQTDRLPGIDNRKDKTKSNREMFKATQMGMSKLQPKLQTKYATSSLQSCT